MLAIRVITGETHTIDPLRPERLGGAGKLDQAGIR
jgi:hypothetical protein